MHSKAKCKIIIKVLILNSTERAINWNASCIYLQIASESFFIPGGTEGMGKVGWLDTQLFVGVFSIGAWTK